MRVETVTHRRSRESRSTKFTFPIGWPSMVSARTLELPSRVITSRQSVPKLAIRKSPLRAKARPLGSVPCRKREASVAASAKFAERFCAVMCWLPSAEILTTPPRASAAHSVPSRSARMHSGRSRSCPTYCSAFLSIPKSRIGLDLVLVTTLSPAPVHGTGKNPNSCPDASQDDFPTVPALAQHHG